VTELAAAVQRHHGFSAEEMNRYKQDFWLRCRSAGLRDKITRVGRQPIRKLGRHERSVAPAKLALEYGLPHRHIVKAIAAALRYRHPADEQAVELARRLKDDGVRKTVREVGELGANDPLLDEIENEMASE